MWDDKRTKPSHLLNGSEQIVLGRDAIEGLMEDCRA